MHRLSKFTYIYSVLFLFVSHLTFGKNYYVPRALNNIPFYLVNEIRVDDKGATQKYLKKDDFGRDIIEVTYSDGHVIWDYFDASGRVSSIERDRKNSEEVLYTSLRDEDGKIKNYHPDAVDSFRPFLREDCIVKEADNMPYKKPSLARKSRRDEQLHNMYDDSEKRLTNLSHESSWWPYALIGGGSVVALGAYGIYYLFTNTATGSRYLRRNDLWSMWRPDEPYEVLLLLEPQDMAQDLMHDITIRYPDATNLMQCFLEDLQEEYDTLLQWLQFRKQLAPWCISLGGAFDMIEHRLMLLDRMRDAVYYWRAQQLRSKKA